MRLQSIEQFDGQKNFLGTLTFGFLERGHQVFGIVQGSTYSDLRVACAQALADLPFLAYAVGGVSVGSLKTDAKAGFLFYAPFT